MAEYSWYAHVLDVDTLAESHNTLFVYRDARQGLFPETPPKGAWTLYNVFQTMIHLTAEYKAKPFPHIRSPNAPSFRDGGKTTAA